MTLAVSARKTAWRIRKLAQRHGGDARMAIHFAQLRLANRLHRTRSTSTKPGRLFVVINVDTEGPCTVRKNKTWEAVEAEVRRVNEPAFRQRFLDAEQRPFVLSWFIVDWVGGISSIGRDVGFHRIFDRYQRLIDDARSCGYEDRTFWHYHHMRSGHPDRANRDWKDNPLYEEIVNRRVLERAWFPCCYRAGNTWEDTASSLWLERWIPFDFSNRSPQSGVNYSWARAPLEWRVYHPSTTDVQAEGNQKRWLARSLSIENGMFRREEVEAAFLRARTGDDAYVSFFTHDYKDMTGFVSKGLQLIFDVWDDYKDVELRFASATEVLRELTGVVRGEPLRFKLSFEHDRLLITSNRPLQGPVPWVAASLGADDVRRLVPSAEHNHRWTLERPTRPLTALAVAGCTEDGQTAVEPVDVRRWTP